MILTTHPIPAGDCDYLSKGSHVIEIPVRLGRLGHAGTHAHTHIHGRSGHLTVVLHRVLPKLLRLGKLWG